MTYSGNLTVLVVDDSEFFATSTAENLEEHGIDTVTATGALEALEVLEERTVDCVVSDYHMPEMTGLELYRTVEDRHGELPFILLTGRGDEEVASRAIAAGVDEYLRKLEVVEDDKYGILVSRIENAVVQYRTQRKYELLVENSPEAIAQVREDGRVLAANDAVADDPDVTPEDLIGDDLRTIFPTEVGRRRLERGREAIEAGEPQTFEDDIGDRYFHNIVVPVDVAGEDPSFQLISRDITRNKERERELEEKTEQLAVVNRIVRHDIQNDVTVLSGWAEILEDHVDEDGEDYLERIRDTTEHIGELTTTTREFVEVVTGDGELEAVPVSLREILGEQVEKQRTTYEEATFEVGEIPPVTVRANEMLSSVFRNLLSNAVQHNDKAEPIVEVTVDCGDDTVVVSVADNGPGVSDPQKDEIFGKGEMDPESPGSGIGLYLVGTLVEGYGGRVRVEDRETGKDGAIFRVELPRAE